MTNAEWLWDKASKGLITVRTDCTTWYDKRIPYKSPVLITYKQAQIAGCKTLDQAINTARKLDV